jgi:hypothetical protein
MGIILKRFFQSMTRLGDLNRIDNENYVATFPVIQLAIVTIMLLQRCDA